MNRLSIETYVGIFVILGFLCSIYISINLGGIPLIPKKFSYILAKFDSVSGLKNGSIVDMAGVEIGKVESIIFDNIEQVAIIKMKIRKEISVDKDTIGSIRTSGIIGNKYIKLIPGGSDEMLQSGDYILETESALDIEELISKYLFGTTQ